MSNEYIHTEVKKIIEEKKDEFPQNMALAGAWILTNFKGFNLKIIDARGKSSLADYYVLASANNTIQCQAMADTILREFKGTKAKLISKEGYTDGQWILLDFGDLIIHIFEDNSRDIFDLDNLWGEYPQITIPQEYYFNDNPEESSDTESTNNYF